MNIVDFNAPAAAAARAYLAERGLLAAAGHWDLGYCDSAPLANRITFPVQDANGVTVGHLARRIGDADCTSPKYTWNPPAGLRESRLYGLPQALAARTREVVIVEGSVDVIIPSDLGLTNIVGVMSCELRVAQAALISDHWSHAVVAFDGDSAGNAGALAACSRLRACGVICRAVCMPADHDPDSFVRAEGIGAFLDLLSIKLPAPTQPLN